MSRTSFIKIQKCIVFFSDDPTPAKSNNIFYNMLVVIKIMYDHNLSDKTTLSFRISFSSLPILASF
jgi:hypothetical protein